MIYHLDEGILDIPAGLVDRSINMLMAPPGEAGFSLIVSRDRLETGETLDDFIDRQLKELARQVDQFTEISRQPATPGRKGAPMDTRLLEFHYRQHGQTVHQRQCVMTAADRRGILILTGSSPIPFDSVQNKRWRHTIESFRPRT